MTTLSQFFPGGNGGGSALKVSVYTSPILGGYIPYSSGGSWLRCTLVGGGGAGSNNSTGNFSQGGQGGQTLTAWLYNTSVNLTNTSLVGYTGTSGNNITRNSFGSISGSGSITITLNASFVIPPPVGMIVQVTGLSPTSYNGAWTISASTTTSVTLSTTGSGAVSGTATVYFPVIIATFPTQASAAAFGSFVQISGCTTGYDSVGTGSSYATGTVNVLNSTTTTVKYFNASNQSGAAAAAGTLTLVPLFYNIGAGGTSSASPGTNTNFGSIVAQGGAGGSFNTNAISVAGGFNWGIYSPITAATSSSGSSLAGAASAGIYLQNVNGGMGGTVNGGSGTNSGGFAAGTFPNGYYAAGGNFHIGSSNNVYGTSTGNGGGGDSLYGFGGTGGGTSGSGGNATGYGGGGGNSIGGTPGSGSGGILIIEDFGSNG